MHTNVKPCKNTPAAYGWAVKFREPSSFDLAIANGWTSSILVFRALFITSYWLVCHAMAEIGSNATDALTENIRVDVLKFQMPGYKTYTEINCRMKV